MKIAFLFAGQGAQYIGMGKTFYQKYGSSKAFYDDIKLDFDVKQTCFEGPVEILNDTAYAQSCILATSLAIAKALDTYHIIPAYVAGLSLGEYSALTYAQALTPADALEIVRQRGQIMANALPAGSSKMAAVLNSDIAAIEAVCQEVHQENSVCEIANYNSPAQTVITGSSDAIDKASALLLTKGVRRVIPLQVSGAFHSSLLLDASKKLKEVLDRYVLKTPRIPVVFNVSGDDSCASLQDNLLEQLYSSVKFMQSVEFMIAQGVDTFVEIGPGNVLSGFVRRINKDVKTYSIDSVESIEQFVEEVKHGK
ncbi:MAG: ACP S-malonyltransferase [Breznakia sp.]